METFLIYLVIAIIAIYNGVKNYKKEQFKNKQRAKTIEAQQEKMFSPFPKKDLQTKSPIKDELVIENRKPYSLEEEYLKEQTPTESTTVNYSTQSTNNSSYNNENIAVILARIEKSASENEKAAFSENGIESENRRSLDLELNSPEDYRRAFIHTLIFERKY